MSTMTTVFRAQAALVTAALSFAVAASGCAKLKESEAQKQGDLVNLLSLSLQVHLPDYSYTARDASGVRASGSNLLALKNNIFNQVAPGLKEMSSRLAQTVSEGARSDNSLRVVNGTTGGELSGTRDDTAKTISWTYRLGAGNYFTGTQLLTGASADLTFPPSVGTVNQFTAHLETSVATVGATSFTRKLVLIQGSSNLSITSTFTTSASSPSKVEFTGSIGGIAVEGSWDLTTGGRFKDVTGTFRCFDGDLQDVVCPAS